MCFDRVCFESPTPRFLGFPPLWLLHFFNTLFSGFPKPFEKRFDGDITFRFLDLCLISGCESLYLFPYAQNEASLLTAEQDNDI